MTTRYFTGLFLAATAFVPMAGHAQDFTPTADRILSDPTFLPSKGQIYGQSDYAHDWSRGGSFDSTGARTSFNRTGSDTFGQSLAYGLTDRLSLNLGIDYETAGVRNTTVAGIPIRRNDNGFSDPTFGAAYRIIDQTDHPFTLDLKGSYTPDLIGARSAADGVDGTVAFGGDRANVGLALGRETRVFTIQGVVAGQYNGDQRVENQSNGTTSRTSSYWAPSLGVNTQARLNNRVSLNVDGSYTFNGDPDVVNGSGARFISDRGDFGSLKVAVNYHFVPNKVVGSLGYTHVFYGDTHTIDIADPTRDSRVERSSNLFGASLRYAFR